MPAEDPKRLRRFSIALLGGLQLEGKPRLGDRLTRIALLGGMDLDLAGAEFVGGKLTIVKVSLIGGHKLRRKFCDGKASGRSASPGGAVRGRGGGTDARDPQPCRPSEVRPGRLVAARAGYNRHETPGT